MAAKKETSENKTLAEVEAEMHDIATERIKAREQERKRIAGMQSELNEQFPKEVERQLKKGGASLTYIPVSEVISRLNKVFGFDGWSYEIVKCERDLLDPDFIVAHGASILGVATGFVFHLQDAQRAARHNHARLKRERGHDQHVNRVTVSGDGLGHVAVVARVVHRGRHEAVDEQRAAFLVDFVLDRIGVHRDLDDDVDVVGDLAAGGDAVEAHGGVL